MRWNSLKWKCVLFVAVVYVVPAAPVWAQAEVLHVIPDDAIGFVLMNRPAHTNDKLAAAAKRMKIDLPGNVLEMAKGALGFEKGVAEKKSIAVAAMPGKGEGDEPRQLVFVPVSNYQTFIAQLQPGKSKDGITAITLKFGKSMLAGKKGEFAVLAEAEDRDMLLRALKADSLATWAEPLTAWLTENDVAGVMTGRGLKLVGMKARQGLDEAKQNLGGLPPEAQIVGKFFEGIEACVKSVETDVTHVGLGARIDDAGNIHVTARAQFQKGSGLAKAGASVKAPPGGTLAGLPSGPFVLALGAAFPEEAMQSLMSLNIEMMKGGGQNIPAETLTKLEKAYAQMMKGMGGMSFVWQVGKENEPLFSNMAAVMHTKNAAGYLASYEKSLAEMNEIAKGLNLPFLPAYELKKVKVGGKQAIEVSMDFGAGLGGVPEEMQKMFKSMFGPDGKMIVSMAVRDNNTIVMRYTGAEGLKEILSGQDKGLGSDAGVTQVTRALPAGSQWTLFVSPKGMTDFAGRIIREFSPIPVAVPKFPATPPVAAAARVSGQGLEVHVVIPSGVVDSVGEFVEQLKRMFQGEA